MQESSCCLGAKLNKILSLFHFSSSLPLRNGFTLANKKRSGFLHIERSMMLKISVIHDDQLRPAHASIHGTSVHDIVAYIIRKPCPFV